MKTTEALNDLRLDSFELSRNFGLPKCQIYKVQNNSVHEPWGARPLKWNSNQSIHANGYCISKNFPMNNTTLEICLLSSILCWALDTCSISNIVWNINLFFSVQGHYIYSLLTWWRLRHVYPEHSGKKSQEWNDKHKFWQVYPIYPIKEFPNDAISMTHMSIS